LSLAEFGWLASGRFDDALLNAVCPRVRLHCSLPASAWSRPALVPLVAPFQCWTPVDVDGLDGVGSRAGRRVGVSASVAGSFGCRGFANGPIVIVAAMSSLAIVVKRTAICWSEAGRRLALSLLEFTVLDRCGSPASVVDRLGGGSARGWRSSVCFVGWVAIGVLGLLCLGSRSRCGWVAIEFGGVSRIAAWALFQLSRTKLSENGIRGREPGVDTPMCFGGIGDGPVAGGVRATEATAWLLTSRRCVG